MIQELDLLFDQGHLNGHQFERPSSQAAYAYHGDFCESMRNSIEPYSILGIQVAPVSSLKQLLLFHYSHALVKEYNDLVYSLQANYARKKEGLSDPRKATLTVPMLAEITRDICFYEEVKERVGELAGAVDALVESLKILLADADNYRDFQCLTIELQSTCKDLQRTMAILSATLETHIRLFEVSQGMHGAQNVRLLGILASIFLPLTLTSGLLSMQTRFSNLHYLLYDFFGVNVLLGTIVALILIALRFYLWWNLVAQRDHYRTLRRIIGPQVRLTILCFFALLWGVLLSSFLVGMIKDVSLGMAILGLGFVTAFTLLLLIILTSMCVLYKIGGPRSNELG